MMMPILLLLILLLTAGVMFYQKREKSGKILIPVIVLIPIMVSALLWFLWIVFMAVFVGPYLESGTTTGFHNLGTIAYEVKSCIDGVDPYSLDNIQNTTVTSSWMDNNSLQINTQVGVLCGGENVTAININAFFMILVYYIIN